MKKENKEHLRWEDRRIKELDNPSRQNGLAPLTLQFSPFKGDGNQRRMGMKGEFQKESKKVEVSSSVLLYQRKGGAGMSWEFIHFDYLSGSWNVTDRQGRS